MWSSKENGIYLQRTLLFQNVLLFLSCSFSSVWAQCEYGMEPTCTWVKDPKTTVPWVMKKENGQMYVEITGCEKSQCGIALIQGPWLPPLDKEVTVTLEYKIYGTSAVFLRLNMNLDDTSTPTQLFSKSGNYAHAYPDPDSWRSATVKIPATHTKFQLVLKGNIPYKTAMVAVKNINLDPRAVLTSSSSTTSTTTAKPKPKPVAQEDEKTSNEIENYDDDDDYEPEEASLAGLNWQPKPDSSPTLSLVPLQATITIVSAGLFMQMLFGCAYCSC